VIRSRFVVRITPDDVGKRVTIRSRLHDPGGPPATETVGILRSWQDDILEIEQRDGSVVRIRRDDLQAGRVV
jgi:N-acetylglutamate synthase